jgi:AmmeMemoRadiSam system protein A
MLSTTDRNTLLEIAHQSILCGLENGHATSIRTKDFNLPLQNNGASFVTLHLNHKLRGCIGSLEAYRPLIRDVLENAYAAAFCDPRFAYLALPEVADLAIHISVLTPAESIKFTSEQALLEIIRPGMDGLILEDSDHRGTFLPSVWDSLPEPELFLAHLKQKAGLPANYWSDSIKVSKYQTESFGEE